MWILSIKRFYFPWDEILCITIPIKLTRSLHWFFDYKLVFLSAISQDFYKIFMVIFMLVFSKINCLRFFININFNDNNYFIISPYILMWIIEYCALGQKSSTKKLEFMVIYDSRIYQVHTLNIYIFIMLDFRDRSIVLLENYSQLHLLKFSGNPI